MRLVQVNTTAVRYHVGENECGIIVIKELARTVISNLPFSSLHKQILIHLIYFVVLWLNFFPATQGISD